MSSWMPMLAKRQVSCMQARALTSQMVQSRATCVNLHTSAPVIALAFEKSDVAKSLLQTLVQELLLPRRGALRHPCYMHLPSFAFPGVIFILVLDYWVRALSQLPNVASPKTRQTECRNCKPGAATICNVTTPWYSLRGLPPKTRHNKKRTLTLRISQSLSASPAFVSAARGSTPWQ